MLGYVRQNITPAIIAPIMRFTGFRFSKDYRWGTSRFNRIVYALVNTVEANYRAGMPETSKSFRRIRKELRK